MRVDMVSAGMYDNLPICKITTKRLIIEHIDYWILSAELSVVHSKIECAETRVFSIKKSDSRIFFVAHVSLNAR